MKKALSALMVAAMLMTLIPFFSLLAFAEDHVDSQGVTYRLSSDGTYYSVYSCASTALQITIPSDIDGIPVTRIGDWAFEGCSYLKSITIGSNVTFIGIESFLNCTSLEYVEFPVSVTTVSGWAFSGCTALSEVSFSNTGVTVGYQAFLDCTSLKHSTYDNAIYVGNESNPYMVLVSCTSNEITSCKLHEDCTTIAGGAFEACENLESVEMSDKVTVIGESAFQGCSSLTEIDLPDTLTALENSCFYGCAALKTPVIPDSVVRINFCAFYGCDSFSDVVIPASVETMGSSVFSKSDNVKNVFCEAPSKPSKWNNAWTSGCTANVYWGCENGLAFETDSSEDGYIVIDCADCFAEIEIPALHNGLPVYAVDSEAFLDSTALTEIIIPDSITEIPADTFDACDKLENIYCQADTRPSGWSSAWLGSCDASVAWGFNPVEDLEEQIIEAEALSSKDYSPANWQIIQSALSEAKAFDTDSATLKEIKDAADALKNVLATVEKIPTLLGDVNGDGIFDGSDVVLARQYDAAVVELDADFLALIEVTGDGIFDGADVVVIVQMDANVITDWPING